MNKLLEPRQLREFTKGRATAEYPTEMCQAIAGLIAPLCSPSQRQLLDLDAAQTYIPIKQLNELPVSYEDGGGLFSEPDWSRPHRSVPDCLHDLRQQWVQIVLKNGLVNKLKAFLLPVMFSLLLMTMIFNHSNRACLILSKNMT